MMNSLKVYYSMMFKTQIKYLNPLFVEVVVLVVLQPETPIKGKVMDGDGKVKLKLNRFEKKLFQEKVKQWINNIQVMHHTIQALSNIIWG